VSPANPFRSVFHPNQTKILFLYHSNQSLIILGFAPYAEAEIKKTKTNDKPQKSKTCQKWENIIFSRFKMIEKKYLHFQLKSFIDSF